jgi:hypothetical protein
MAHGSPFMLGRSSGEHLRASPREPEFSFGSAATDGDGRVGAVSSAAAADLPRAELVVAVYLQPLWQDAALWISRTIKAPRRLTELCRHLRRAVPL